MELEQLERMWIKYVEYVNETPSIYYTEKSYQKFAKDKENVYTITSLQGDRDIQARHSKAYGINN